MMAVHEAGHVLHARLSGATVPAVSVPLAGFSITELSTNPHPHFVAWGGPVWGSMLPVLAWAMLWRKRWPGWRIAQFFAGFCLIANGVYLGVGWVTGAGDAGDIVSHGTPVAVLVGFGVVVAGAGLLLWHLLGRWIGCAAFQAAAKQE
jgi:mannose/fructose/N-acetylgalactosamine-specific phosphotransferase system component IIC